MSSTVQFAIEFGLNLLGQAAKIFGLIQDYERNLISEDDIRQEIERIRAEQTSDISDIERVLEEGP